MNIQIYFNNKFIELSSNDIQNSQNQAIKKSYLLNDNKLNFNKIIDEFLFDPSNDNIKIILGSFTKGRLSLEPDEL